MSLQSGTRLGVYEVVAAIGAGGMGEVYRARDTKLNRDVALKILSELFATDVERLARFTRVDPTSMNYEFTVEDPTTWTTPWTAFIPWNKIDPAEQMYEYGCHEDNFDIVHFLIGARTRQKAAR